VDQVEEEEVVIVVGQWEQDHLCQEQLTQEEEVAEVQISELVAPVAQV
jgi:hypothetical protein